MSQKNPLVLFIGDPARGAQLFHIVQPQGWHVYVPTSIREALGMYVAYQPDIVIIDPAYNAELANQVQCHLSSVNANPVLVIGETISSRATARQLITAIEASLYQEQQRSIA